MLFCFQFVPLNTCSFWLLIIFLLIFNFWFLFTLIRKLFIYSYEKTVILVRSTNFLTGFRKIVECWTYFKYTSKYILVFQRNKITVFIAFLSFVIECNFNVESVLYLEFIFLIFLLYKISSHCHRKNYSNGLDLKENVALFRFTS